MRLAIFEFVHPPVKFANCTALTQILLHFDQTCAFVFVPMVQHTRDVPIFLNIEFTKAPG